MQNKNKISEQQIRENIIFSHCQTLEDYNKVFINLAQRIENERIKLVIIDNIQSVGDNFIKALKSLALFEFLPTEWFKEVILGAFGLSSDEENYEA